MAISKERRVATPEGAQFYGLPIGAVIGKDIETSKNAAAAKLGIKPPRGALTGGGTPSLASAPKPINARKPSIDGPLKFKVGKAQYGAPAGSKLVASKTYRGALVYVLTEKGDVHAFTPEGEVSVEPAHIRESLAIRFSGDLTNDTKFEAREFDGKASSHDLSVLAVGANLVDKDGTVRFTKIGDGRWKSPKLDVEFDEKSVVKFYERGELIPETTPETEALEESFSKTEAKSFADMTDDEFIAAMNALPDGTQIRIGPVAVYTKNGETFEPDQQTIDAGGRAGTVQDFYYAKSMVSLGGRPEEPKADEKPEPVSDNLRITYKLPMHGVKVRDVESVVRDADGNVTAYEVRDKADHFGITKISPEYVSAVEELDSSQSEASEEPEAPAPKAEPSRTMESPEGERVYAQASDFKPGTPMVEARFPKKDGEPFGERLDSTGAGTIIDAEELPEKIYHVTSATSAVGESGYLRMTTDTATGGLGGVDANTVSFTRSQQIAEQIRDDMRFIAKMMQDERSDEEVIRELAEDIAKRGGTDADKEFEFFQQFAKQHRGEERAGVLSPFAYFASRQRADGTINPGILGTYNQGDFWRSVDPNEIGIFESSKEDVKETGAVVSAIDYLEEVRVFGDVKASRVDEQSGEAEAQPEEESPKPEIGENPAPFEVEAQTELGDVSYRGIHTAPNSESEDSPIYEVDRMSYPSDVYSDKGKRFYGTGHVDDQLALDILNKVRGNPDADVVVYRAISPNADPAIHVGDWVTPSETYAREHGIGNVGQNGETQYALLKTTVKAGQLWTNADSLLEWGYDPRPEESDEPEEAEEPEPEAEPESTPASAPDPFRAILESLMNDPAVQAMAAENEAKAKARTARLRELAAMGEERRAELVDDPDKLVRAVQIGQIIDRHRLPDGFVPPTVVPKARLAGEFDPKKNQIGLSEQQNDSTFIHEFGHALDFHMGIATGDSALVEDIREKGKGKGYYWGSTREGFAFRYQAWIDGAEDPLMEGFFRDAGLLNDESEAPEPADEAPETIDPLAHMSPAQRRAYGFGYRAGEKGTALEIAERTWTNKPRGIERAWRDGYTDGFAGFDYGDTPRERLEESNRRTAEAVSRSQAAREQTVDEQPDVAGVQTEEAAPEGLDAISDEDAQQALDALEAHSSFHISYGLKSVPDNPIAKLPKDRLRDWALEAYPSLAPKAAAIQLLRDRLGIEQPGQDDDSPRIVIGSDSPKQTATGSTGGQFSAADIEQAIEILEGFDGKLFKSELSKRGNPLGTLSPNDIVGFDKDKTVTKRKFIDMLRGKLAQQEKVDVVPEPNNTQGLQVGLTPNGTWRHLTLDAKHPVCDHTKDIVDVRNIELNEAQRENVARLGATILVSCRRCDKWSKSYVRRNTFRQLAGLS